MCIRSNRQKKKNKKTLLEYATYLKADGKSLPRQDKLLRTVKILAELLGSIPFKEARKKDLVEVLRARDFIVISTIQSVSCS